MHLKTRRAEKEDTQTLTFKNLLRTTEGFLTRTARTKSKCRPLHEDCTVVIVSSGRLTRVIIQAEIIDRLSDTWASKRLVTLFRNKLQYLQCRWKFCSHYPRDAWPWHACILRSAVHDRLSKIISRVPRVFGCCRRLELRYIFEFMSHQLAQTVTLVKDRQSKISPLILVTRLIDCLAI